MPYPCRAATGPRLEPWRNLYAQLAQHGLLEELAGRCPDTPLITYLRQQPLELLDNMLQRRINSPPSSSAGRLFDAVAAALDLHKERIHQEGQAAMVLEQLELRGRPNVAAYTLGLVESGGLPVIDTAPLWPTLFDDLRGGRPPADIARAFHYALADTLLILTERLTAQHRTQLVALSGGVLQNRLLLERLQAGLRELGLTPLLHRQVPANDGGVSLGQACIAACILQPPGSNI